MTAPPPDGSRDRRIEDPTNLWIVHPLSRSLLRPAMRVGMSANAVSLLGLGVGAGAAWFFSQWRELGAAWVGLALATGWLVADGLDGMVARATGTASALGRFLDGLCDHGVFALIYVALAASLGTRESWTLGVVAAVFHAIQSSLFEGERARYHRRVKRLPPVAGTAHNQLVRAYDLVAFGLDRLTRRFDAALAGPEGVRLAATYGDRAVAPMRLQALLSANMRVLLITAACLLGDPRLFWWGTIGPLTLVAITGIAWHRSVEARLLRRDTAFPTHDTRASLLSEDHTG